MEGAGIALVFRIPRSNGHFSLSYREVGNTGMTSLASNHPPTSISNSSASSVREVWMPHVHEDDTANRSNHSGWISR
jgi:hypothetical protein